jgi:hypothetical protein
MGVFGEDNWPISPRRIQHTVQYLSMPRVEAAVERTVCSNCHLPPAPFPNIELEFDLGQAGCGGGLLLRPDC